MCEGLGELLVGTGCSWVCPKDPLTLLKDSPSSKYSLLTTSSEEPPLN